MDNLALYNKERWEELAEAGVEYSRPFLDLTPESAKKLVDPEGMIEEIAGKEVLCLAGGGGQQSAAFALLGANVTVIDISEIQLERDRSTALHYDVEVKTVQGDMRDLSCFPDDSFDIVWHAHSLNFLPEVQTVFGEVARVLRKGGKYRLQYTNPFIHGLWEVKWNGEGYPLGTPYTDGAEMNADDPFWEFEDGSGEKKRVKGPREFRHNLGTVIKTLAGLGFVMMGLWEDTGEGEDAEPGSWEHFKSIAPPWLTMWWSAGMSVR